MPRSLSPEATVTLQLESDADTEQEFYFRSLTMDDERTLGNAYDQDIETPDDLQAMLTSQLVPYLTGWKLTDRKNQPVKFDATKLTSILSTAEASELAGKLLASNRLTHEEKKSAELLPLSDAANSANTAPQNGAANQNKSASNAPAVVVLDAGTVTTDAKG